MCNAITVTPVILETKSNKSSTRHCGVSAGHCDNTGLRMEWIRGIRIQINMLLHACRIDSSKFRYCYERVYVHRGTVNTTQTRGVRNIPVSSLQ